MSVCPGDADAHGFVGSAQIEATVRIHVAYIRQTSWSWLLGDAHSPPRSAPARVD